MFHWKKQQQQQRCQKKSTTKKNENVKGINRGKSVQFLNVEKYTIQIHIYIEQDIDKVLYQ